MSFTHWEIIGTPEFVGLNQYRDIFSNRLFLSSLKNTLYFTVLTLPGLIILGMALALLVNLPLRGRIAVRTIVYSPVVISVTVIGILWGWIYSTEWGMLNYYLMKLGLPKISWLGDPRFAMPSIAFTTIWWTVGGNMILYLAGLQDIPRELYEAARIDGAGPWQSLRYITLPMLTPVHGFVIPVSFIACSRVFGQVAVMTGGGPYGKTFVILQYIYQTAFQDFNMGNAAAAAMVLLVTGLIFTIAQLRALKVI